MALEVAGEPAHTRCLSVLLTKGEGDSVAFRADVLDLRKAGLMALAGRIATAGIIHKMELTGSFAAETDRIEHLDWRQTHVMHEANEATRGECCRDPMHRLSELVGTRLGEGFAANLKHAFGGPLGCTHIGTLFQELSALVARRRALDPEIACREASRSDGERIASRSVFFDAFLAGDGASTTIDLRLADIHFAPHAADGSEVLARHDEARLISRVAMAGWQLEAVEAKERLRRGPSCGEAPWIRRDEAVETFAGHSLGGGLARRCLDQLGSAEEDALIRSCVLNLSPGMTQLGAALSDGLAPASEARPGGFAGMGPGPCYMLRANGPLVETIRGGPAAGDEASEARGR